MSRESLARRLRVLRAERGLTLRQVEEITGVDKHTISNVERGESKPYDATLARLARGYDVPIDELLMEKTAPEVALPLAEAPQAGQSERKTSAYDVALLAGRAQVEEDRKTIARAAASESAQGSFVSHLNDAMRRLREEYPAADLAEACVDLARRYAEKEQENTRLIEALEQHQRETARQ
jgi:transcriptional regulator with XRE-family HTH domain